MKSFLYALLLLGGLTAHAQTPGFIPPATTGPGGGSTVVANASEITSGTLSDSRLSTNVPLKNTAATISGLYNFTTQPTFNSVGLLAGASGTASQWRKGDNTLGTFATDVRSQLSTTGNALTYNSGTGTFSLLFDSSPTSASNNLVRSGAVFTALGLKLDASAVSTFGLGLIGDADASAARTRLSLGNVDNTADAAKPISTAQQTALNAKEDASNKSTSTSLGSSNTLYPTQNAVKTYVDAGLTAKLNSSAVSSYGLTLLDDANAAQARATLGAGTASTLNTALDTTETSTTSTFTSQQIKQLMANVQVSAGGSVYLLTDSTKHTTTGTNGEVILTTVPNLTPGSYTNANLTVDAHGIVTSVTNGAPGLTTVPGLTPGAYTNANLTVDANGIVTSVTNGAPGLTTVPGLTPGSYTNANLTVDANGIVTAVSNGTAGTTLTDQWGRFEPGFMQLVSSPNLPRVVLSTTGGAQSVTSGTGAANGNAGSADGFPRYSTATQTGTTSTGYAGIAIGGMSGAGDFLIGSANYTQMTEMKVQTLPDATEDYEVYSGLTSGYGSGGTPPTHFIGVRIRWNGSAVEYHFVSRTSNVETTTNLSITATSYFKYKIVVPADRSKVELYLNGSTTPITHTTNIPASGTGAFFWHGIMKKAGTTTRPMYTRIHWPYLSGYSF